jgi:glucose 1-dehydrogenase
LKAVAVFPGEKTVRLIDHPPPPPAQDTEVLVRILDVGICGTDREIARLEHGKAPPGLPYLVLGHESLGEVREIGAQVTGLRPGDLVAAMVRRPCDVAACPACALGRPDFCLTGRFTERGIDGRHGFMTEQIVEQERYLVRVPPALRAVGVLLEPLSITEKALIEVGDVQDRLPWLRGGEAPVAGRGHALVLGAGPIGLLGAMALRLRGFETTVYSREPTSDFRSGWVDAIGARYLCSADCPPAELPRLVGNIDLMYEATGAADIAFRALPALGVNGVFIFTGVPGRKAPIELDADLIMRNLVLKNQLVYGTVNAGPDALAAAVADLEHCQRRWPGQLDALITGRYPPESYRDLLFGPVTGIKRVVTFASG